MPVAQLVSAVLYNVGVRSKEHQPSPELNRDILRRYAKTFIPRQDCYPIQTEDGRYLTIKRRFQLDYLQAHLKGIMTLGAYALDEYSRAKWICIDADSPEQWQAVLQLATDLRASNITPYLEASRRGGHLWLFFSPLPGSDARQFGNSLVQQYNMDGIELYPKQDVLSTGVGSLVRLPLGRHRITGRRYHFITPEGKPLAPTIGDQIQLLAQPQLVPQDFIEQKLFDRPKQEQPIPTPAFERPATDVPGQTLSERLKNRISVYDFVNRFVELDQNGTGFCPFHDDHHRSFGVNQDHNYWHCWAGCGGGSLIDFWMKWREQNGQDGSFTPTITELGKMLL